MTTKIRPGLILLFLLFLGGQYAWSQVEKTAPFGEGKILRYTFKNWYQGKDAAVTFTFDDGYRSQFLLAVPVLDARSFKGTFFIVTNRIGKGYSPGWDSVRFLANNGHEIGSHSMNHADFDTLVNNPAYLDSLNSELLRSRQIIDKYLPFQKCRSFAWPYGKVSQKAIEYSKKYYLQARSSFNNYELNDPVNMNCLSSQKIYSNTPLKVMNKWADDVISLGGWLIERYHGFRVESDTNGYEPVDIETFRKHLDFIKYKDVNLWVATLSNVASYIRERQNSGIRVLGIDEKGFRIALQNKLPDSLNTVPLSVDIQLDGSLRYLTGILHLGKPLPYRETKRGNTNWAMFDAVPNNGEIELLTPLTSFKYEPQGFQDKALIVFTIGEKQKLRISISDPAGKFVQEWTREFPAGENSIVFKASKLPAGEYTCWIEVAGHSFSMKMMHLK